MLAVVMAGGKGSRLRPLTCDRPKPMVPVVNRPLIEHVIGLLAAHGWKEIALTLGYQAERIQMHLGEGRNLGVGLRYSVEDRPLGTAGGVKLAAGQYDGTILVGSGDSLADFDLGRALAYHREREALVTIILARVESPLEYGVVVTAPDGRVTRFLEKPGWGEVFSDTVNTGFYLIEPETLALVPPGEAFDFSRDLFPLLLAKGKPIFGYVAEGYWSDVGNIDRYLRTHLDILAGRIRLSLPGREIGSGILVGRDTEIDAEARLEAPVVIGDFCRIDRGAVLGPGTVVGDHALLAEGSSLKRSVVWRHVYCGRGSEARGAVIGDRSILRNNVTLLEGSVVSSECLIGAHTVLQPQVKIWPGKRLESGSIIRENLVWGERSLRGLFGANGITAVGNRELTPEYAVRLGASFAGVLGHGRRIGIGSDGMALSRLLKRALTAGVLGAGADLCDLGTITAPVVRFAIGSLGLAGGVYLRVLQDDTDLVSVQFYDASGLPLTRQSERGVEQAFYAEEINRAGAEMVGEVTYAPGISELYLDGLRELAVPAAIGVAGLTVVSGSGPGPAAEQLAGILTRLGCRHLPPPAAAGEGRGAGSNIWAQPLADIRKRLAESHADLAVAVDRSGEELAVLAPGGREVERAELSTLLTLSELRGGRAGAGRLPVSVTASRAAEDLARIFAANIVRTKAQRRFFMEEYAAMTPGVRGLILPAFDALASLVKLLGLLAAEGRGLNTLLDSLPVYHRVENAVTCAWEAKGRLMRRLFEETRGREQDLTDGLGIRERDGWALILPDGDEPFIRIYSEARTPEEADALNRYYREKLAALGAEGDG